MRLLSFAPFSLHFSLSLSLAIYPSTYPLSRFLCQGARTPSHTTSSCRKSSSVVPARWRTACLGRGIGGSGTRGTRCGSVGAIERKKWCRSGALLSRTSVSRALSDRSIRMRCCCSYRGGRWGVFTRGRRIPLHGPSFFFQKWIICRLFCYFFCRLQVCGKERGAKGADSTRSRGRAPQENAEADPTRGPSSPARRTGEATPQHRL